MPSLDRIRFAIDRGGTFTDVVATVVRADGIAKVETCKLLSVDPEHYPDAPSEGIRRVLERVYGGSVPRPIPEHNIDEIRMGTTVATNALLERKGVACVQVVTQGFGDILLIGNQSRQEIFALEVIKPQTLPSMVIEAKERVRVELSDKEDSAHKRHLQSGYTVEVLEALNVEHMTSELKCAYNMGIRSVCVCLMHSYAFRTHEERIGNIARDLGFTNVSLSCELMPVVKFVPRTTTSSVDAYLSPLIAQYISNFRQNFANQLRNTRLLFAQSDGGMTDADHFFGFKAVLSGPAGGVVGCSQVTSSELGNVAMVGFDMGGTSTDVSRCQGTSVSHTLEANVAGTMIQAPQVEVHTVASGGGSILKWENGMFVVGPESAGAFPGPACYGRGGPLTITDANLMIGRINPKYFPCLFGHSGAEPLNADVVHELFQDMSARIQQDTGDVSLTAAEIALHFVAAANETMCRPIRNITEAKGHRAADHVLTVFGGAGGQHACGVAGSLGINRIFFPRLGSYLSAVGIGMTDIVEDRIQTSTLRVDSTDEFKLSVSAVLSALRTEACTSLARVQGFSEDDIEVEEQLNLRFEGTNTTLTSPWSGSVDELLNSFNDRYERQFGFVLRKRKIIVDEVWVRAKGNHSRREKDTTPRTTWLSGNALPNYSEIQSDLCVDCQDVFYSHGWMRTPMFRMCDRLCETRIVGPAIIIGDGSTLLLEPCSTGYVSPRMSVLVVTNTAVERIGPTLKPLYLTIFSHRFMSIAEQMGYTLQRTAISTNIKERLDFSCAIFDPEGNLVANAPHIPVHLGAMGAAVRWQREYYGDSWSDGDVMVSNHPCAGGSHLPDITVMSACFLNGKVIFYVASRGHHADVGGICPGSMPPFSRSLDEEGAAIKTLKLVEQGQFNEDGIRQLLLEPGVRPGSSGCRTIEDSISDLKAQVAANRRGVELVQSLINEFGQEVVHAYMHHIQDASSAASRNAIRRVAEEYGTQLSAEDFMDDGSAIRLTISIDPVQGTAVFDFRDSDPQVLASTNCPTAVVHSAVIYCLRCLVGTDIPLNQGCMAPVTVLVRPGSILAPDDNCAVVAGNVLTSQRVTDVIFTALRAVACSQGCMNNFTFGHGTLAYYETICGGSGAGPSFHGASCVQTHMTNTRITDPEILETRYPVLLVQFAERKDSGGRGRFKGGNGCIRCILFLAPLVVSILSERRAFAPKGLLGGDDGARGRNILYSYLNVSNALWSSARDLIQNKPNHYNCPAAYQAKNVSGKNTMEVQPGDAIQIFTPGGGGFGTRVND